MRDVMVTEGHLPLNLKAVAALLIAFGVGWGGIFLLMLDKNDWAVESISLLCIPIGIGLLQRSRLCWWCATILAFISVVISCLSAAVLCYMWQSGRLTLPYQSEFSRLFFVVNAIAAVEFLAACWILWVLTRPHVRQLFKARQISGSASS